jgi:hypothetical protein
MDGSEDQCQSNSGASQEPAAAAKSSVPQFIPTVPGISWGQDTVPDPTNKVQLVVWPDLNVRQRGSCRPIQSGRDKHQRSRDSLLMRAITRHRVAAWPLLAAEPPKATTALRKRSYVRLLSAVAVVTPRRPKADRRLAARNTTFMLWTDKAGPGESGRQLCRNFRMAFATRSFRCLGSGACLVCGILMPFSSHCRRQSKDGRHNTCATWRLAGSLFFAAAAFKTTFPNAKEQKSDWGVERGQRA